MARIIFKKFKIKITNKCKKIIWNMFYNVETDYLHVSIDLLKK